MLRSSKAAPRTLKSPRARALEERCLRTRARFNPQDGDGPLAEDEPVGFARVLRAHDAVRGSAANVKVLPADLPAGMLVSPWLQQKRSSSVAGLRPHEGCVDEPSEERMWLMRFAQELRMKLACQEEGMVR